MRSVLYILRLYGIMLWLRSSSSSCAFYASGIAIGMPRRTILYTDERRHNRPPGGEIVELSTALALLAVALTWWVLCCFLGLCW